MAFISRPPARASSDMLSSATAELSRSPAASTAAENSLLELVRALARQAAKETWDNAAASQSKLLEIPA